MKSMTRREAIGVVAATGAGAMAAGAEQSEKKPRHNTETPVPSKAGPDVYGPREMFAVVDSQGDLKRGLHAVSSRRLDVGVYEVTFARDVRRGAYLATAGGHGYEGIPLAAVASVIGRASEPRGVLVYTSGMNGNPLDVGFHLLVVCPEGYA
jgi:hypothetical protein